VKIVSVNLFFLTLFLTNATLISSFVFSIVVDIPSYSNSSSSQHVEMVSEARFLVTNSKLPCELVLRACHAQVGIMWIGPCRYDFITGKLHDQCGQRLNGCFDLGWCVL